MKTLLLTLLFAAFCMAQDPCGWCVTTVPDEEPCNQCHVMARYDPGYWPPCVTCDTPPSSGGDFQRIKPGAAIFSPGRDLNTLVRSVLFNRRSSERAHAVTPAAHLAAMQRYLNHANPKTCRTFTPESTALVRSAVARGVPFSIR